MRRPTERGFILVTLYMLLGLLLALGAVLISQAVAEVRAAQRAQAGVQAWYLAEAGVDRAIAQLKLNFLWNAGFTNQTGGPTGSFSVQVEDLPNARKRLTSQGVSNLLFDPIQRWLEVVVQRQIPLNFYDNIIWAAQNLDFNGTAYSVTGNVIHADTTPSGDMGGVDGTVTYDPAASPLPRLSFQQLYDIAQAQGNVYDAADLAQGADIFPDSFWYQPPTDPNDPRTGIPNVNYVMGDLVLNGNIGTIGGFFVVVGDVLTNPSAAEDTIINGNGQVAGAIYTTGDFRVNGGGNGLNVDGGVWAGDEARLNGHTTLTYNAGYMEAIEALGINADVQVVSWRGL